MRPEEITLAIFEKYTPEEMADTAAKLVQALADKETVETEKKLSDSAFKERINQHEAVASDMAKRYGKGGETAQIGCAIRYDIPEVGKKSYILVAAITAQNKDGSYFFTDEELEQIVMNPQAEWNQ